MTAYASWSVVFGEQPSAAKWNILGTNDASFNDGTGIGTDAIKATSMFYGMIRNRQGGAAGDATWQTAGSTNVATDAKDVFFQAGCRSVTGIAGTDTTITFPSAYTFAPLVLAIQNLINSANVAVGINTVTTTTFVLRVMANSSGDNYAWLAFGQ